jgi:hypothetical protein
VPVHAKDISIMARSGSFSPSVFPAPDPEFARMTDHQRRANLARAESEDRAAEYRALLGRPRRVPHRVVVQRQITRGVLATSAVLATLFAAILTSGPIETPGPSGTKMPHHPATPRGASTTNAAWEAGP